MAPVSEKTLIRLQSGSGLLFATFLALHLTNTVLATAGQDTYDAFQRVVRYYYQFPLIEVGAVLVAALVHGGAGLTRMLRRRAALRGRPAPAIALRTRLHRLSGYYLMLVFAGHVVATRLPGLLLDQPADFSFLNFSLAYWPWYFYPYYLLFAVSGVYHLGHGSIVALRVFGARLPGWATAPKSRPVFAGLGFAAALAVTGVFALGGNFHGVDARRFPEFKALYERFAPRILLPWAHP